MTPKGYSLAGYGAMIADGPRMAAYAEALRRAVRPGSVVLDMGAGPGIMALLACTFGARRVFAVEPDDSIHVGRELAAANGCADRITFVQEISTAVELPEPADVVVSDLRGALPLFQQHIPSIVDARARLLAPGGTLIPQRDTLHAAVVQDNPLRKSLLGAWQGAPYGLNVEAALRYSTNSWTNGDVPEEALLGSGRAWAVLDYREIASPDVKGSVTLPVQRAGEGCGLLVWFDAQLLDGIGFSNAPPRADSVYGQSFFPWPANVPLAAGDEVAVTLEAKLTRDGYVWRWRSEIRPQSGAQAARFDQSSFFGTPLDARQLKRREAGYVPALNGDGAVDRLILGLCDGQRTLAEIAAEVRRAFPQRFATPGEALAHAGDVAARYAGNGNGFHKQAHQDFAT